MLYHSARGSVDYTIVGSPTIVDGVASGFVGRSAYLGVNGTITYNSNSDIEIVERFKTLDDLSIGATYLQANDRGGLSVFSSYLQFMYCNVAKVNGTTYNFDGAYFASGLQANTWYTAKLKGQNGIWTASLYDANGTLIAEKTKSDFVFGDSTITLYYGMQYGWGDEDKPVLKELDLNNTYIKIDNQPWFGMCPIEVKKHQLKGPVGYTVVGTPTITDGVASGFANGSYVQTDTNFSFAQPLEIRFTATTSNNVNTSQLLCSVGNGNANRSFGVTIEAGGKMGVAYTFNGSAWVGWLPSSYVFEANTRYNFFIDYMPSSYFTINVKKSTESVWTTFTNTLSTPIYTSTNCPFIFGQNYQNKPFLGSIDLNETYIKVNGKLWYWQPQETKRIVVNGVEVWTKPE